MCPISLITLTFIFYLELGLGGPNIMAKLESMNTSLCKLDNELVSCIKEPINCSIDDLNILIKDQEVSYPCPCFIMSISVISYL